MRIISTVLLLSIWTYCSAQSDYPPIPDSLEYLQKDYKEKNSAFVLASELERKILANQNAGSRIVEVGHVVSAFSEKYDYLLLEVSVLQPSHWEFISHYRLVVRREKGGDWSGGQIVDSPPKAIKAFFGGPIGPNQVDDSLFDFGDKNQLDDNHLVETTEASSASH